MKKLIFVLASLMLAASAHAVIINLEASLDGAQEVPASGSTATGSAAITLNDVSKLLSWNISWSGLSGPATAMHFHGPAAPGSNAGVQVNIGAISGLASPSNGSATISAAQATDLLAGLWYINIHTAASPGGEIRGQVVRTPDSGATAALLCLGLFGLAALRRKIR